LAALARHWIVSDIRWEPDILVGAASRVESFHTRKSRSG
jgi:hypothetical protein